MRRGHRADGIRITKAFSLYTKEDVEILAYYFFCLTCNVDNSSISDNSDFYRILRTLVENTKKEERFQQVISTYIEYLKKPDIQKLAEGHYDVNDEFSFSILSYQTKNVC